MDKIKSLWQPTYLGDEMEGYVVRATRQFSYGEFRRLVAKYVRPNHVTSSSHWKYQKREWNRLVEKT